MNSKICACVVYSLHSFPLGIHFHITEYNIKIKSFKIQGPKIFTRSGIKVFDNLVTANVFSPGELAIKANVYNW